MPFEFQWAKIPLAARWGISLLVAAVLVVALVIFVHGHNGNGEVGVSAKNLKAESRQAAVVIGEEQAPTAVSIPAGTSAIQALRAAVERDMRRQITQATIAGPLQRVFCVVHGGTLQRTGYHCVARADDESYPFLAVVTSKTRRAAFCEKVYPPTPSENIPVSRRCDA